ATADLRVGPDLSNLNSNPILKINALGVAVVNAYGFAADLDVGIGMNVPGISLTVGARVLINTTGATQDVDIPVRILNFLNTSTGPQGPVDKTLAADLLGRLQDRSNGTKFYEISLFQPDITDATTVANLFHGGPIKYTTTPFYVCAAITGTIDFLGFA